MRVRLILLATLVSASADASPNVPSDDPAYDALARLQALDVLPPISGGFLPLTRHRVARLLGGTATRPGVWFEPIDRLRLTTTLFHDRARPFDTSLRPRDLTIGSLSIACEHTEGRPCGNGAGNFTELSSNAGYGDWVSASVRLRAQAGQHFNNAIELDRLYLNSELGPVAVEVGRDVVAFGPSARTHLAWGDNAPPITHARLSTSEPFPLTSNLRGSAVYLVGRLRSPQTVHSNLVTISRLQLDIANNVEVGLMQLLQLGGDGASELGVWDFIAEHIRRSDLTASASDSSNRRFGGDVAFRIRDLSGARFYFSLIFEDIRKTYWYDAVRYDADHLLGIDLAAIGPGRRHGLTVEWQQTGHRSQEHRPRTTGFTNGGRVVGSSLGPDAKSLYAGGRVELGWGTLYPWLELAWLSSDTYQLVVDGPINPLADGVTESRYRLGTRVRLPLPYDLSIEANALAEHVDSFAFDPAANRTNFGLVASVTWQPHVALGTLQRD